jgi:hypothetical protein
MHCALCHICVAARGRQMAQHTRRTHMQAYLRPSPLRCTAVVHHVATNVVTATRHLRVIHRRAVPCGRPQRWRRRGQLVRCSKSRGRLAAPEGGRSRTATLSAAVDWFVPAYGAHARVVRSHGMRVRLRTLLSYPSRPHDRCSGPSPSGAQQSLATSVQMSWRHSTGAGGAPVSPAAAPSQTSMCPSECAIGTGSRVCAEAPAWRVRWRCCAWGRCVR